MSLFHVGISLEFEQLLTHGDKSSATLRRNFGKETRKDILARFHNVVSKPRLLYGSKCWTLGKAEGQHVEAAEIEIPGTISWSNEKGTFPK
jgi:hypothetical protein